ncbi:alanyl-tRNA synthetase [Bradyrhizobium sp. R2.2-H]|uniref:alanine--tRNA ligase n=1 Tax=unclassified Bradyrhizobium TaxID=2631580 RepID=UPI0010F258F5|nr:MULTISPECIES: alanine--tRNA ligase [unclassified Bradyrhizobium]TCU68536.1 alanyl-tRNA synthetase [Bradyrhizobium sp. Y-H1]TCU69842.1 alanyl-tRNA synthetase [Bradyrhizobium sp. R2.2-H]
MSGVNEIRSTFLNFFAENGHEIVPSSPLVPRNDPTLMFTNAGMVQFKNVFTGVEKRPYQRATTSQKCVRAGGKHNDLDNVGYTARHLTFFEMLGNFSFGDYFKERAIELAWKLITGEFGLKKDKLLVTVYHTDDEAAGLWKKIAGFSEDRIIRIPTSDNFWAMGDTGPCGPCSEIFIDRGEHIWGGPPGSPEEDGDRFLEFWNLVFMQFEQVTKEERQPLPRPSIDTGMGLERMACILQGVESVFETDLFKNLIDATASALGTGPNEQTVASFRVIADHLRSSAFLVADGVLPSNEGRGYVLRRIMRRAMRHAQLLGAKEPLMHRLVWALVREMGQAYPDLMRAENLIEETLRLEETRFRKTLSRGLAILDEKSASLKKGDMFDGDVAFTLYDTYGFPLDLTQDALKSRGIGVDQAAFTDAMERQREKARASWAGSGDTKTADYWFPMREKYGATEFLGYDLEVSEAVVQTVIKGGPELDELPAGWAGELVFNQTPFYAEAGGQVSDKGWIRRISDGEILADVMLCHKEANDLIVHNVQMKRFPIRRGDVVRLEVDHVRRSSIRANHSATHLIHEALRQVLGDHIAQRGSMVAPDRLRFDFVHPKPITAEELARVEDIANDVVLENDEVTTRIMGVDEAREAGARALFGEKYGDEVRVVSMGRTARERGANALGWSVELCGGTHVKRTGDIGLITLTGESAVASGVRRIEALTGNYARRHANDTMALAKTAANELRTSLDDVPARIAALMEERKKLERELSDARKKLAMGGGASAGNGAASSVREVGDVKLMARAVEGIEMKDLKSLADDGKKQIGSGVVAIVGVTEDGKAGVVVGVTQDLTARFNAVNLVRIASEALGGKGGGGRPDMAQAGGPDGAKAAAALTAIEKAMAGA